MKRYKKHSDIVKEGIRKALVFAKAKKAYWDKKLKEAYNGKGI